MIARPSLLSVAALVAVSAAVALGAVGCGGSDGGSLAAGTVATVGGQDVTQAQLDQVIAQAQGRLKAQGQAIPAAGSQQYQALQQGALQYLVQRIEYEQKAKELGITIADARVQQRLDEMIKQYFGGSKKKYEDALKKQGTTDAEWRAEIRITLLEEDLFKKIGETATVTDAEIEDYNRANPQATREVRHILVKSKTLADDLYRKLKAGASFAVLAKRYSIDPGSKDVGGKLTEVQGQFVPEFEKVSWALKVHEISKPVKTQYGWHVIEALGPVKTSLDAQRRQVIRETLLNQKKTDVVTNWLQDLKQEYAKKITYAPGFAPPATTTTTTSTS